MPKAYLYFHTLRHLRPIQIFGRVWFRLHHPKPDLSPAPPLRPRRSGWTPPALHRQSMHGIDDFTFLGERRRVTTPADWNNPGWDKLWLYNLHYFDDLNAAGAESRKAWHEPLVSRWIEENPPATGNGWEPYPISLRIVNWVKWILGGNTPTDAMLHSLAVQARFLSKRLETHLLGNHLLANAKGLVFAGCFFSGREADEWLATGMRILEREIPEQVLPDGGHFERSPMYHSIILEDLLDLINITGAFEPDLPPRWAPLRQTWPDVAVRMRNWLQAMCHPDGEIALFNDAAFGIAPPPSELESYSSRLGLPAICQEHQRVVHLADSGTIRIQEGSATCFIDAAPIGPDYLPGHAHADTLSFELSLGEQRVIVDSGTSCYGNSPERQRQRSTPAHNTVCLNGENSSEVWGGFRVARRARPFGLRIHQDADGASVVCSHDGYKRLPGKPVHQREWTLRASEFFVEDHVISNSTKPVGAALSRYHFHPDVQVSLSSSEREGSLLLPDGRTIAWQVTSGKAALVPSTYHPEFGKSLPNTCLQVRFEGSQSSIRFQWG